MKRRMFHRFFANDRAASEASNPVRYVVMVLTFTVAVLLVVGATIWTFDPRHRIRVGEVNLPEITDPNLAWQVKPFLAKQYPHDALMFGSSRIFYVDPTLIRGFRFFNAAQPYMHPQRIYAYLEKEAIDLRMIVIGFDFDMFWDGPAPTLDADPYLIPLFHAFPAVDLARRTVELAQWFNYNASYLIDGASFIEALAQAVKSDREKERRHGAILRAGNMNLEGVLLGQSRRPQPRQIAEEPFSLHLDECCNYKGFVYNPAWLEYLSKIRNLLDARGIGLVVLITPIHERVLERIASRGKMRELNQFRRDLCGVFPDAFDVSVGVYSNFENFFDWDPMHFMPDVGAEIINKAISGDLPRCTRS